MLASVGGMAQSANLQWARTAGGTGYDTGLDLAFDANGNVYATGFFEGTVDFDPSANTVPLTSAGGHDIFVTKMDALGNLMWAKSMGGGSDDQAHGIVVDTDGNVYTAGSFSATADFDPNAGDVSFTATGPSDDIFICKLDADGNYLWAKIIGNYGSDVVNGIAMDANNNIYFTGYYNGIVDFDPNTGTVQLNAPTGRDIYVCKLTSNSTFVWVQSMGGTAGDEGLAIAVDASENVYTTGFYSGTGDFDPGAGVATLTGTSIDAVFVSKLDALGDFVWAVSFDSDGTNNHAYGIAVDDLQNVYTVGHFEGVTDFDPSSGVDNLTAQSKDIFISKLDSDGMHLWAKRLGGSNWDYGYGITVDAVYNVITTGVFEGANVDFDPNAGTFLLSAQYVRDAFISILDASGNYVWAGGFGGALGLAEGKAVAVDAVENLYMTGYYIGSVDFDPSAGLANYDAIGAQDAFVLKLDQMPTGIAGDAPVTDRRLYPNPNDGTFYINHTHGATLQLYNALGEMLQMQQLQNSSTHIPANVPTGIYIAVVTALDGHTTTTKISVR